MMDVIEPHLQALGTHQVVTRAVQRTIEGAMLTIEEILLDYAQAQAAGVEVPDDLSGLDSSQPMQ
jgi:hypothetical protein